VIYTDRDLEILWCIDRAAGVLGPKKRELISGTGLRWEYITGSVKRQIARRLIVRSVTLGLELTEAGRAHLHLAAAIAIGTDGSFAIVSHSAMSTSDRAEAARDLLEDEGARIVLDSFTLAPRDKRRTRPRCACGGFRHRDGSCRRCSNE